MWVNEPQSRCTTKFNRSWMTKIIRLQSFPVDGIPHHVKDLRPCFSITTSEEDSDDTSERFGLTDVSYVWKSCNSFRDCMYIVILDL